MENIDGFGLNSQKLENGERFRVQNELISWKEQTGTVIGIMHGTQLTDRMTPEYYIVQWDDGLIGGISPKKARTI